MTGSPAPRPALKKSADAQIHPAAPGLRPATLRHAGQGPASTHPPSSSVSPPVSPDASTTASTAASRPGPAAAGKGRKDGAPAAPGALHGPFGGATSDSLRPPGRRSGGRPAKASGKKVEFSVKIPKSLRKEFQAAVKADRRNADDVVAALLRGWLDG